MKVLKETIKKGVKLVAAAGLMAGLALAMPYNVNTVQAATSISSVEITIPELVAGNQFSSEVTGGGEQFTGAIVWKIGEEEAGDTVLCETVYTATVTLTARSDEYIFLNGEIAVSVNGDSIQNVTVEDAEGASTITFGVPFEKTNHVLEEDDFNCTTFNQCTSCSQNIASQGHLDENEDGVCDNENCTCIVRVNLEIAIKAGEVLAEDITNLSENVVIADPIQWYRQEAVDYVNETAGMIAKCGTKYSARVNVRPVEGLQFDSNVISDVYINDIHLNNAELNGTWKPNYIDDYLFVRYDETTDSHTDTDEDADGICDACETIIAVACTFDSPEHGKELATVAELTQAVDGVDSEITWTVDTVDGEVATGTAKCNTTYVAKITFRAKDGYEWLADRVTFGDDEIALVAGENDKEKIAVVTFDATEGHKDTDGNDVCDYCELPKVKIVELTIADPVGGSELATELTNTPDDGVTVTKISWNVAVGTKAKCNTEYAVSILLELDQKTNYFAENNEITFTLNGEDIEGSSSVDGYTSSWELSTAMTTPDHTDKEEVNDKCDYCGMTKVSKIEVTFEPLVAVTGSLPNKVTFDEKVFKYPGNDLLHWYKKEITDDSGEYESVLAKTGVDCGKQYYLKTSELTLTSPTSYYWDNENEVVATVNDVEATIEWQNDGSFIIQSAPIYMYHEEADSDGLCGREGCNTIRKVNFEVALNPGETLGKPVLNDTVSDFQTYSWYIGENGVYDDEKVKCGTTYRLHVFSIKGKKLAESGYSKVDSGTVITVNNMSVPEENIEYRKDWEDYTIDYIFDPIPECADTDENGRCDACDELMPGVKESLMGCHLTLNGKIAMNFHMKLDSAIANYNSNAKMVVTLPDGSIATEIPYYEAEKDGDVYIFSYEVAAKEMTDEITVQMWWDDFPEGKEYTYSVQDYADAVLNAETGYDAETIAFVEAMVNYGAYAQTYFDYNTEELANDILEDTGLNNLTADTLKNMYEPKKVDNDAVGTFESANLTLKTETSITVKIKLADGVTANNATFEIGLNGVWDEVEATKQGAYYVFTKENIKPSDLDTVYNFKVTANGNSATLKYGALSYCYSVLANKYEGNNVDALKDVVKALYEFNQAADAYNDSRPVQE